MSGWWWLRMGAWLQVGGEPRLDERNVRSTVWRFCFWAQSLWVFSCRICGVVMLSGAGVLDYNGDVGFCADVSGQQPWLI